MDQPDSDEVEDSEKRPWVTPELRTMHAGIAEAGTGVGPDMGDFL